MTVLYTTQGSKVPTVSYDLYERALIALEEDLALSPLQIAEAASYSMAMVVRYALGLSALGGRTLLFCNNSLEGQIALATGRHLIHGGGEVCIWMLDDPATVSTDLQQQLKALEILGIVPLYNSTEFSLDEVLSMTHNVIFGCRNTPQEKMKPYETALQDTACPLYSIGFPYGINPVTGTPLPVSFFSSATLLLGIPLQSIAQSKEYMGRMYLADVSLPREWLEQEGIEFPILFSEQPVIQLLAEDPTVPPKE